MLKFLYIRTAFIDFNWILNEIKHEISEMKFPATNKYWLLQGDTKLALLLEITKNAEAISNEDFRLIMENNFIQISGPACHAVAYTIGSIFKHIIDCVQLYFTNGFTNIVL